MCARATGAFSRRSWRRAVAGERLAKRIARAGVCSRREAEKLIAAGCVTVDGKVVDTAAYNVAPQQDVRVDGQKLAAPEAPRLWLYHKPRGLVTTHRDPEGRPTVFTRLPKALPRVISVGRLDFNSEGLLLLTNSGALARHLELPATGWIRRYRVRAFGRPTPEMLERLGKGITINGVRYGGIELTVESRKGANFWATAKLKEGKNREIRRVLEHFECKVSRLMRVAYGPFQLGNLPEGHVKEVPAKALGEALGKWMMDDRMTDDG